MNSDCSGRDTETDDGTDSDKSSCESDCDCKSYILNEHEQSIFDSLLELKGRYIENDSVATEKLAQDADVINRELAISDKMRTHANSLSNSTAMANIVDLYFSFALMRGQGAPK